MREKTEVHRCQPGFEEMVKNERERCDDQNRAAKQDCLSQLAFGLSPLVFAPVSLPSGKRLEATGQRL
jgi:hypothetical protein